MRKLKATGQRGSWFAELDEKHIPCVHDYWVKRDKVGMFYLDPHYSEGTGKWPIFLEALRSQKQAILTHDTTPDGGLNFDRKGYIALFEIDDVATVNGELRFTFIKRLADVS